MKIIYLKSRSPNPEKFLGEKLDEDSYDELIAEDCDVYTEDGGILLKFRKKALSAKQTLRAYEALHKHVAKTSNRGVATGKLMKNNKRMKSDGTVSKTIAVQNEYAVNSSVLGFFDRYPRIPFCRESAFNLKHRDKWNQALPYFQSVSQVYKLLAPEFYEIQERRVCETVEDWIIPGTVFTTITLNKNFQTAVHTDKGDFKEGLSCITAMVAGEMHGGNLVFPHYRVAVDVRSQDLLLFNSHHMHGNTPMIGKANGFVRLSMVLYYREKMINCLSPEKELQRIKNAKGNRLQ